MNRQPKLLLALSVLLIWGCGLVNQAVSPTFTSPAPPTLASMETPGPAATPELSSTPAPSATAAASSTPNQPQVPGMPAYMNLGAFDQYSHPVGQPLKTWQGIAIMPQAISGQEYHGSVYSYTAAATLAQAVKFYSGLTSGGMAAMIGHGSSGSGANAAHNSTLFFPNMLIYILSYDNDTGHVLVVISK